MIKEWPNTHTPRIHADKTGKKRKREKEKVMRVRI